MAPTSSTPLSASVTDPTQRAAASSIPDARALAPPPVADLESRSTSPAAAAYENAVAVAPGPPPPAVASTTIDRYDPGAPIGLAAMGKRMVSDYVPRTAAQAEPEIARVLERAGAWYGAEQQPLIVNVARASWGRNALAVPALPASSMARSSTPLKDEARRAFWAQRNFDEAIDLHLRAFGADPYDAELAGNLASLYLRASPAQPAVARQLAMHAMALTSAQARSPRVQDWGTFAVASALVGRDNDATQALFVTAALANNLGMTCRTALDSVARYGERMRVPVESMLLRIQQQGRDRESAYCAFPPRWNYASRFY